MPLKDGKMTPRERRFTESFARTGCVKESAAIAGYSSHQGGSQALARAEIQAEIARIQQERLFAEVLPLAIQVHLDVLRDPLTPAGARVQAVKLAYERTLGAEGSSVVKEPHEMDSAEIQRALADARLKAAALESVAADRARPVIDHEFETGIFD